jgi:hypothetical protein
MMAGVKFDATQKFDAPADMVIRCYASEELYAQLPDFERVSRPEFLDRTQQGDSTVVRVRYRFTAPLPAAALAIIDPEKLTWIEESTYNFTNGTAAIRLIPDHYGSKMKASASSRFVDDHEGSRRTVGGELKVKVLLVAGQVERVIVDGLTDYFAEEAAAVSRLL